MSGPVLNGAHLIADERLRQIGIEGFTSIHDSKWTNGELVAGGICYARLARRQIVRNADSGERLDYVAPGLDTRPWNTWLSEAA
jgi:hypothetical protein